MFNSMISFADWFWYVFLFGACIGAMIVLGIWRLVHWMNEDIYK